MKTKILNFTAALILLCPICDVHSQTYNNKTFNVSGFTFLYSENNNSGFQDTSGISNLPARKMDQVTEVKYLTDSIILASSMYTNEETKIPVQNINSINIRTGSNFWLGTGIGAGAGTLLGIVTAAITYNSVDNDPYSKFFTGMTYVAYPLIGFLTGSIIGGVIGGNSKTYDTYDFTRIPNNKQERLLKILNSNSIDM